MEIVYTIDIDDLPPSLPCSVPYRYTEERYESEYHRWECTIEEIFETTPVYDSIRDDGEYEDIIKWYCEHHTEEDEERYIEYAFHMEIVSDDSRISEYYKCSKLLLTNML